MNSNLTSKNGKIISNGAIVGDGYGGGETGRVVASHGSMVVYRVFGVGEDWADTDEPFRVQAAGELIVLDDAATPPALPMLNDNNGKAIRVGATVAGKNEEIGVVIDLHRDSVLFRVVACGNDRYTDETLEDWAKAKDLQVLSDPITDARAPQSPPATGSNLPRTRLFVAHAAALISLVQYLHGHFQSFEELQPEAGRDGVIEKNIHSALHEVRTNLRELMDRCVTTPNLSDETYLAAMATPDEENAEYRKNHGMLTQIVEMIGAAKELDWQEFERRQASHASDAQADDATISVDAAPAEVAQVIEAETASADDVEVGLRLVEWFGRDSARSLARNCARAEPIRVTNDTITYPDGRVEPSPAARELYETTADA